MDPSLLAELKGRLGRVIGERWKLVKLLGLGASAAVYRGVDGEGWRVAVKIMHSKHQRSEIIRKRFWREQHILDQIQHPHTLRVFETAETSRGIPYIVMELLEGTTLARIMAKRGEVPLELERVVEYMLPVLEALELCHERGIIHRDLKPANVFLTQDGVIKLLDFGVARWSGDGMQLTRDGTALGTPAFMSPEQASGHIDLLDERSDLFSIGAMMHYLLCGQYLHGEETAQQTYLKAASTPAPSLARRAPHLPRAVPQVVDRAVAWSPEDRWQRAEELSVQLRALVEATRQAPPRQRVSTLRGWSSVGRQALAQAAEQGRARRWTDHLEGIFRGVERALAAAHRHGPAHAMSVGRRQEAWAITEAALEACDGELAWVVRPDAFEVPEAGQICWSPPAELEHIPHALFASGVRGVELREAFSERDFDALLAVLGASDQLAPEDDMATAIWDRRLLGLHLRMSGGLGAARIDEHAALERGFDARVGAIAEAIGAEIALEQERHKLLEGLGAQAPLEHEDRVALAAPRGPQASLPDGVAPSMDERDLLLLRSTHAAQRDSWAERLGTTMGDVIAQARREGDELRWIEPLGQLAQRLARSGRTDEFTHLLGVMMRRLKHPELRHELVSRAIDPPLLRELLCEAGVLDASADEPTELDDERLFALTLLIDHLDDRHLPVALEALTAKTPAAAQLQPPLLEMLRAELGGHERDFGDALQRAEPQLAAQLLEALLAQGSTGLEGARAGLQSAHLRVRLMCARALEERGADATDALAELAWAEDPQVRAEALEFVAQLGQPRHTAWMARRFAHPDFHHYAPDEKRRNFEHLARLSRQAAEQVAADLVRRQDPAGGAALAATRALAAEFLGQRGRSDDALAALDVARRRHPANTRRLQEAAQRAYEQLQRRRQTPRDPR